MPYINKINVGGTDYDVGGTIVELTEAEYDALPEEQKMNGIVYSVGDPDDDGTTSAAVVSYDNTTSGLTAENVQDAVDEINSDLTKYKSIPITVAYNSTLQTYFGAYDYSNDSDLAGKTIVSALLRASAQTIGAGSSVYLSTNYVCLSGNNLQTAVYDVTIGYR